MTVTEKIQREIIALEKDKKNYARRINYKLKKLKSQLEEELEDIDAPLDIELAPTEEPEVEEPVAEEPPKEKELFEIAYNEGFDYDVFFSNVWHPIGFSTLKTGDIIRVRDENGIVLKFYDNKFLEVHGYPRRNDNDDVVIRVEIYNPEGE